MSTHSVNTPRHSPYVLAVKRSRTGLGLYTKNRIPRGKFIVEYCGTMIPFAEGQERGGRYLFELNNRWAIDGSSRKNTARYMNHSCRPNCETNSSGERIYFYARRHIAPDEELTFDYGKEYFDDYIKPHGCRCVKCAAVR